MAINLYLSELNQELGINSSGTFTGTDTANLTNTHVNLYYYAPLAQWQRIFKMYTDGGVDITAEDVTLFTEQAYNIIGDSSATSSGPSPSVGSLYTPVTTTKSSVNGTTEYGVTANKISDLSDSEGDTTDPAAALDFLKELSRAVFGSTKAVDMFSNESDIAASYGEAIESCATNISNEFSDQSVKTLYSDISSGSDNNLLTVKRIYDQLRYSALPRFNMTFGAAFKSGTSSFADGNDLAVTLGENQTGSPTVDVLMTGTTIDSIVVNTTGGGFIKGDTINITNGSNVIEITLTDIQASMLNGTLNSDSGTELPLLAEDVFHIELQISNHVDQQNAKGDALNTIEDTVTRKADLHVKLFA